MIRITDIAVGGLIGAIIGAIVAVNLVILAGPDEGYESSIGDVFEHNAIIGVVTVAVLAAGPIAGVVIARRIRNRQAS